MCPCSFSRTAAFFLIAGYVCNLCQDVTPGTECRVAAKRPRSHQDWAELMEKQGLALSHEAGRLPAHSKLGPFDQSYLSTGFVCTKSAKCSMSQQSMDTYMSVSRDVPFETYVCSGMHLLPVHSLHMYSYTLSCRGNVIQHVSHRMSEAMLCAVNLWNCKGLWKPTQSWELGETEQRDVWESSSQSLKEAGCNESCFAKCCCSTGPLWFLPSDAFLCYYLHRIPKTAPHFECLIWC